MFVKSIPLFLSLLQVLMLGSLKAQSLITKNQQVVVVLTQNWDSVEGELAAFERNDNDTWIRVLPNENIAVVVGTNGIGLGKGSWNGSFQKNAMIKVEGDKKAPAGIFNLQAIFGYEEKNSFTKPTLKMPYLHSDENLICVDDPNSKFYSQVISQDTIPLGERDWNSWEQMNRDDDLYKYGVLISHNTTNIQKGAGSCIFMHIWSSSKEGTLGCTAMDATQLLSIIEWLDITKAPKLLQMTKADYKRFQKENDWPEM